MIGVHDGDTLTVLVDRQPVKVRLAEIDAPELGQPFGKASREALAAICAGQPATVEEVAKDRYGRTVGRVACAGEDASTSQVRQGMAWVYDRYSKPGSPLYPLQDAVRQSRSGLWADPSPVPPWDFRRPKR